MHNQWKRNAENKPRDPLTNTAPPHPVAGRLRSKKVESSKSPGPGAPLCESLAASAANSRRLPLVFDSLFLSSLCLRGRDS